MLLPVAQMEGELALEDVSVAVGEVTLESEAVELDQDMPWRRKNRFR